MLSPVTVLALLLPLTANAQVGQHFTDVLDVGAQAIGVVTRESPAIQGRALTEGYLTQPAIMTELKPWNELVSLKGTVNLEGATLKRPVVVDSI